VEFGPVVPIDPELAPTAAVLSAIAATAVADAYRIRAFIKPPVTKI
jgi:hypothetical protein